MENEKQYRSAPEGRSACRTAVMLLTAFVTEAAVFFRFFPYPTGRVLMLILLQPLVLNLMLMLLPDGRNPRRKCSKPVPQPESEEETPGKKAGKLHKLCIRLFRKLKMPAGKIRNVFLRYRMLWCLLAGWGLVLILHLRFWKNRRPFFKHPVSPAIPTVLALGFFLLLALEIWMGHTKKELSDPEGRYGSILGNLQSQLRWEKFLFLAGAVAAAMPMLELPALYRQYYSFLMVWFALQTAALVLLFALRLIRHELTSHPDLRLLVRHRKKGDLNLLGYLEDNTGITMRSLWSIGLIRKTVPYALILGACLLWLSTGIVQIAPNQRGALYRLGRLSDRCLQPGLHMILPWPFDAVDVYDTESLKEITVGYTTDQEKGDNLWTEAHGGDENKLLLGGGNELVSINLRIEYKIDDLNSYLRCSNSPESLLESAAYEAVTANTISTDLETLLDVDRVAFSRHFEQDLTERISRYDTGLQVVDVVIESIHPPVEVSEVYQKIISAGIDAQRIVLDAEAKAATVVADAKTTHDSDINQARAASSESIAQARASVSEFMASLDADKAYGGDYRYYKYLEAVESAYSDSVLVIVGEGVDSSHLFLGKVPS